jgi:hypothetical protein
MKDHSYRLLYIVPIAIIVVGIIVWIGGGKEEGAGSTSTTAFPASSIIPPATTESEPSVMVIDQATLGQAHRPLVRMTFQDVIGQYIAQGPEQTVYTACRATITEVLAGQTQLGPLVTICATAGNPDKSTGIGSAPPTPGSTAIAVLGGTVDVSVGAVPYTVTAFYPATLAGGPAATEPHPFDDLVVIDLNSYRGTVG